MGDQQVAARPLDIPAAATAARDASPVVSTLSTAAKNALLRDLAVELERHARAVLEANTADLAAASASGLPKAKLQRLALSEASIDQLRTSVLQIAELPDPVGAVVKDTTAPSGLRVRKVRSPLGVIAMIYEARPGVTIDAFSLAFKAGNACILKGGREAVRSNDALAGLVHACLLKHRMPPGALVNLSGISRDDLITLLRQDHSIDLVIPRGGVELIRFVAEHSRIPTVQHYHGINHIVIDQTADPAMALEVCVSAKTSAPATCNAVECILVHAATAPRLVPALAEAFARAGVQVRGTPEVLALAPTAIPADEGPAGDFGREFLDLIVAMKIVPDLDAAIEHIRRYGSNHTEAILTTDPVSAERFTREVQASCVLVNASTRMNDGFALGLGAEIGISTSRIHAYGPMGLEELTTTRYVCTGNGQCR
jgi:glutamate-5-semialdehyde dehydrogenase